MTEGQNVDQLAEVISQLRDRPPTIDPTANVLEHVRAVARRLDDNQTWMKIYFDAAAAHVRETAALRSDYEEKLALAEQRRGEALRVIDSKTIDQITTQMNTMAETFRSQLEAASKMFQSNIQEVQRQQYLSAGAKVQEHEGRQQSNWAVSTVVAWALGGLTIFMTFLSIIVGAGVAIYLGTN